MDENTHYMTQQKLDELKVEYQELKSEKIPTIAKRIDDARQMGDLSENAEYHAAREEMAWAQTRVRELSHLINDSEIVQNTGSNIVQIGSVITVEVNKQKKEYTIVGAQEADPFSGRISNESPLGSAFLGKKKKDKVEVTLPAGVQKYKILDVK